MRNPIPTRCGLAALCAAVLSAVLGGCQGAAGTPMTVRVLDASFVDVDGERIARDEFLYRSRERHRALGDGEPLPKVFLVRTPETPQAVLSHLIDQLRLAGVQEIEVIFQ